MRHKSDIELVAEFWGYKYVPADTGFKYLTRGYRGHYMIENRDGTIQRLTKSEFRFDVSWDWLIPTIKKARITPVKYRYDFTEIDYGIESADIKKTYTKLVEFVKWYNKYYPNGYVHETEI